jgi:hypothetical protein
VTTTSDMQMGIKPIAETIRNWQCPQMKHLSLSLCLSLSLASDFVTYNLELLTTLIKFLRLNDTKYMRMAGCVKLFF